jgi:hypothetical protein
MSKRRIEQASSGSGTMQHKWEDEAMQAGGLSPHKDAKDLVFGISTWYLAVTGRSSFCVLGVLCGESFG